MKELKLLRKRIEKRFKGSSFPDTEPLNQLITYVDKWIQHTLRHGEELRLQGSIGVTESIDRLLGGLLKTLCALMNAVGIQSFTQTRDTRRKEQDDILLLISGLAPQIRDYVARLNLPSGHMLLQALSHPHTLGITVANLPSLVEASAVIAIKMTEVPSPTEASVPATLEILGGVPSPTKAISANVEITEEVPSHSEASAPADLKVIGAVTSVTEASSAASVEMTEEVRSPSEASAPADLEVIGGVTSVTETSSAAAVGITEEAPSPPSKASAPRSFEAIENVTSDAEPSATVNTETKRHKGLPLGKWAKALGECIEIRGEHVRYMRAAKWLNCFKRPELNGFFADLTLPRLGKPPLLLEIPAADTCLMTLLDENAEVRSRFHHQLNKAKERFKIKQVERLAKAEPKQTNARLS